MKKNRKLKIALITLGILMTIIFSPIGSYLLDSTIVGIVSLSKKNSDELKDSDFDVDLIGYNGAKDSNLLNLKNSKKVVFINFWGSWCPPCISEMPSIQKLYEKRKDQVEFVLITIEDKPKIFKSVLDKNGINLPVYATNSPMSYNILPKNFPTTYILNKKGEIVLSEMKARDWNDKEINALLDKLIAE